MRGSLAAGCLLVANLSLAAAQEEDAPPTPREGLLAVLPSESAGQVGWLDAETAPGTETFERLVALDAEVLGERLRAAGADRHLYLLVEGVWTKRFPGYMDPNEASLGAFGLTVERMGRDHAEAGFDTDLGTEANARAIRDVVLAQPPGRRVVLIGHSKGGNDATAAVAMFPEIRPRVRGGSPSRLPTPARRSPRT